MDQRLSCEVSDVLCEVGITIDRIEGLLELALDSSARRKSSRNKVEIDFYDAVSQFEVLLIKGVLSYTRGNQKRAGQLLGLKPSTINMKIKAYKLAGQEFSITRQPEETNHAKSEFEGG